VSDRSDRDGSLDVLMDELTERVQAGEVVDLEALLRDHPDQADQIRELLPALHLLADMAVPASSRAESDAGADAAGDRPEELGDFRIVREIGRGGMGIVYEAQQRSLGRRVALKVLPFAATMDPKQLQRFKNEAKAAASLKHEHIVSVYAVGCERGVHFYAMEYVEGQTLAQLIPTLHRPSAAPTAPAVGEATGPYDPAAPGAPTAPVAALSTEHGGPRGRAFYRAAADLIAQAAEALEHAHSFGIVHRDVKPGNLLLDPTGKVYVSDFGLARFGPDVGLTMSGDLLGTLRYMAPEQALSHHGLVDHRADVYALGATLYELLTGRPAVDAAERAEVLRKIAFEEPAAPRKLDKAIPEELETVTLKALAKNPSERYATAGDLADDLRRWLGHQTIKAKPPTLRQRAAKWARRHRAAVWAAVAVAAVLVAALAVLAGYAWHKNGQLTEAYAAMAQARADERAQREVAENGLKLAWQATDDIFEYLAARWWQVHPEAIDAEQRALLRRAQDANRELIRAAAANPALAPHVLLAFTQVESISYILGEPRPNLGLSLPQLIREIERLPEGTVDPTLRRRVLVVAYSLHGGELVNRDRAEAEAALRRGLELGPVVDDPEHPGARYQFHWADLHFLLGDLLFNSGRLEEAEQLFRKARQLYEEGLLRKPFRGFVSALLRCTNRLATFHIDRGETEPARELYRRALRVCTDVVAKNPRDLFLRDSLAWCHQAVGDGLARAGDSAEADRMYRESIRISEDVFHERPNEVPFRDQLARRYSGQGDYAARLGRWAEAEQAFRKALALWEKLAADYPSEAINTVELASTYVKLGRVLISQGRPHDAEALSRQASALPEQTLEKIKAKLGPDHPDTLKSINSLAKRYADLGWRAEALKLREEALALHKAKLGPDHPDTLAAMHDLAHAYQDVGRLPEAVALFEQSLAKQTAGPNPDADVTWGNMPCLALAYEQAGQFDRAEPLLVDLLEHLRKTDGPKSPDTAGVLAMLGLNRLKQHKYAEAEPLLRECLAIRAAKLPDDWRRFNALSLLGGALQGQKKYAEAEPLLLQGYDGMKQREATIPPAGKQRLPEAVERLVALYEATGRADEARAWREKLPPAPRADRAP
jgi:serine/threonine protein kinase